MTARFLPAFLLVAWLSTSQVVAQAPDGRIFAGGFFETLYAAIDMEHLHLKGAAFRFRVIDRQLAAVIVPDSLPPNDYFVLVGTRNNTDLTKVTLAKEDYDLLHGFAKDGVFLAMQDVLAAPNNKERALELKRSIASLPAAQQASAQRFVGARMADLDLPKDHPMGPYVQAYRDHVEKNTREYLSKNQSSLKLQDHQPYSFGTPPVPIASLQSVPPGDIRVETIQGKQYKEAWVGGNLIVVPQSPSSESEPKKTTGLNVDPRVTKDPANKVDKKTISRGGHHK
jgi:hypothetical protein